MQPYSLPLLTHIQRNTTQLASDQYEFLNPALTRICTAKILCLYLTPLKLVILNTNC